MQEVGLGVGWSSWQFIHYLYINKST